MECVKFDYRRLRGKIREVYGTEAAFAEDMGLSRTSMSQRINNAIEFSAKEILLASKLLRIPSEEISHYFFATEVQKREPT